MIHGVTYNVNQSMIQRSIRQMVIRVQVTYPHFLLQCYKLVLFRFYFAVQLVHKVVQFYVGKVKEPRVDMQTYPLEKLLELSFEQPSARLDFPTLPSDLSFSTHALDHAHAVIHLHKVETQKREVVPDKLVPARLPSCNNTLQSPQSIGRLGSRLQPVGLTTSLCVEQKE